MLRDYYGSCEMGEGRRVNDECLHILQSENEPPAKLNLPFSKSPHIWLSGDGFDDPCF